MFIKCGCHDNVPPKPHPSFAAQRRTNDRKSHKKKENKAFLPLTLNKFKKPKQHIKTNQYNRIKQNIQERTTNKNQEHFSSVSTLKKQTQNVPTTKIMGLRLDWACTALVQLTYYTATLTFRKRERGFQARSKTRQERDRSTNTLSPSEKSGLELSVPAPPPAPLPKPDAVLAALLPHPFSRLLGHAVRGSSGGGLT